MDRDIILGTGNFENDELNTAGAADVVCYFRASGTDTATERYFNLGQDAKAVEIIPSDDVTITVINHRTLKAPKTVGTNAIKLTGRITNLTIRTTAARNLKIFAKA